VESEGRQRQIPGLRTTDQVDKPRGAYVHLYNHEIVKTFLRRHIMHSMSFPRPSFLDIIDKTVLNIHSHKVAQD